MKVFYMMGAIVAAGAILAYPILLVPVAVTLLIGLLVAVIGRGNGN